VLGSQGDAGQFRTPRHIIDFMVKIIDPKKDESILDPACGTAGFLISAWKHILKSNTKTRSGDLLTPDERKRMASNIKGYDISPDMVRLSLVNMYLHGFTDPHIVEYDTLTSEEKWNESADVILANPPFMSPKGGIKPHKRFSVQSKRSEVLFVDYMAEHLTPNGRAAIIVPEGIIERDDNAYQKLRRLLIEGFVVGIISLPAGVFQPYTKVKTSVLVLDKRLAKQGAPILFSQVKQAGISLNSARSEILKNDLPTILNDYKAMREQTQVSNLSWYVERDTLLRNGNTLSGQRFRPQTRKGTAQWRRLGDLCRITKGTSSSTKTVPGPYPLVVRGEESLTSDHFQFEGEAVCVPILSLAHGHGQIKRVHYVSGKFAVANLLVSLQPLEPTVLNCKYLYLAIDMVKDQIAQLMQGSVYVTLKVADLEDFEIPVPPMEIQNGIAAHFENLQTMIARHNEVVFNIQRELQEKLDKFWT